ncbi:MAG: hypothetical protein LBV58_05160 [Acholeplasmatales bacterium]|jgi:Trk-type K+ transport system membrane component|nr:hypothetical protein [Acholeplasmatales bacterium]
MKKIKAFFFKTPSRSILVIYLTFAITGSLLLYLPISNFGNVSFMDCLFTSFSSMSNTGLSTVDISNTFTNFGLIILILLMDIGGIGIFLVFLSIILFLGKKIGFKERYLLAQEQNQFSIKGIVRHIKITVIVIISIQFIAFIVFLIFLSTNRSLFYFQDSSSESGGSLVLNALFMAVSLFTNSGFEIWPVIRILFEERNYFMIAFSSFLIFVGGISLIMGIGSFFDSKNLLNHNQKFVIKIMVYMHLIIWIISIPLYIILEFNHSLSDFSVFDKIFVSIFQTINLRSGGFGILSNNNKSGGALLFEMILMFIGASPNSVAGGIRTTTLFVIVAAIFSLVKGKNQVILFKKAIKIETVHNAFIVFISSLTLVLFSTILIIFFTPNVSLDEVLYEVVSAFGTVGLSLGITKNLNIFAEIILIINMFVGRLGISILLTSLIPKQIKSYSYTEIDLVIG